MKNIYCPFCRPVDWIEMTVCIPQPDSHYKYCGNYNDFIEKIHKYYRCMSCGYQEMIVKETVNG